jgi:hypothetical protein
MQKYSIVKLILAILICEAAGIIGSVFTASSLPVWYAGLSKPALHWQRAGDYCAYVGGHCFNIIGIPQNFSARRLAPGSVYYVG